MEDKMVDFDVAVEQLTNDLVKVANDSPLPLSVKALIIKNLLDAVNANLTIKMQGIKEKENGTE